MPSGVEHVNDGGGLLDTDYVIAAPMPSGVEHQANYSGLVTVRV